MPRHSKNNTASSVFTYHEAKSLEYGTKKQRLGRDSFREYNACFLCLQTARDPVACPEGHLACRECMYESILTQKQVIKQKKKQLEQQIQALEDEKERTAEEARQHLLEEFERTQASMLGRQQQQRRKQQEEGRTSPDSSISERTLVEGMYNPANDDTATAGKKRKFELTEEMIKEAADKELSKASQRLADEKARKSNGSSNFWIPTMTPEAEKKLKDVIKPVNTQILCTAAKTPHPVSLKSLIDVKFQLEESGNTKCQCPACLKTLSNAVKISVMRQCGHVICNSCVDMFVKKTKRCYVCETKTKSKDIVDMSPEGTGFASGSTAAVATKWDVAFQ
ncbi:hypothetical protein BX666DRAFT_2022249 [Dichotomocladium elegans]|nr:hypothetical protein BX666DRAFT_2022249 [Dichotomocladium elegans]